MVYHRATVGTHKQWADQVGDASYAWDKFLPWYKKSVNFTEPNMNLRIKNSTPAYNAVDASAYDGSGHLSVTYSNWASAFSTWVQDAMKASNIPIIKGFFSGTLIGQTYVPSTINPQNMHRDSAETAFLQSALGNPNYVVHIRTMAKKILFDSTKKATGVLVDTEKLQYTISARKEVILTAGAFGSPQLLMVSGVGPASTLSALNIPVVADRPGVGQNLQDQPMWGVSYRINAQSISSLEIPSIKAEQAKLYDEKAAGIMTSAITDNLGFEKIPDRLRKSWSSTTKAGLAKVPSDWPEVEYNIMGAYFGDQLKSRNSDPNDGYNYGSIVAVMTAPLSRGTVTIASPDTAVAPLIDPGYYTNQADIDVAVAAFKRVREFYNTTAIKPNLIGSEYYPGFKAVSTDAEIEQFVRTNFNTIWHAASTCAMGKTDDPKAVVDTQARVIGVKGLRVVDASSLPFLPPGHPLSVVCKFCEHAVCEWTRADRITDAFSEKIACAIGGKC